MVKNHYFTDTEDIMLYYNYLIDYDKIVPEYEGNWEDYEIYQKTNEEKYSYAPNSIETARENYRMILDSFGDLAGNYLSQVAQEMDKTGLKFKAGKVDFPAPFIEMWEKFKNAGILPYSLRRENDGLGIPIVIQTLASEISGRADIAFTMAVGLANLSETIERFASEEQKKKWIPLMSKGDYAGAMALSEPNYGSDLPNVRTHAVKQPDGTYLLNGNKIWITNGCGVGDIPSVILTLARTGSPESGARGLSFFIVDGRDVTVTNIEHKLGIKSSPTCGLAFENTPATIIGEEGFGLTRYAMGMMNVARLGVATLGVSVGQAALAEAQKYAKERVQFGKVIENIPAVKKMLDRMEREVIAMRCINMEAARTIDMYKWRAARLEKSGMAERDVRKDEQIKYWDKIATLFTPLSKFYCSETSNKVCYDAIQIHGGVGFTEDFDVARLYRDARILSIYEGTTQLQVVAAIGGIVAGLASTGQFRQYLDDLAKEFQISDESKQLREKLEGMVNFYKDIPSSEDRDYVAFEVVDVTTRLVAGLILEQSIAKLNTKGLDTKRRKQHSIQYNIDSLALAEAAFVKIKSSRSVA